MSAVMSALVWVGLFAALCPALSAADKSNDVKQSPTAEFRGFWNHSGTGAYPGDWPRTAKELSAAGFNAILPNMLWAGAAHYPSDVIPRSKVFSKYGDQIDQCVKAAHRHGLRVHVWKVCWNLGRYAPKDFVERLRRDGRLQVGADGTTKDWLCPSHPKNRELELRSLVEVVRKYPVDGLHLDYIRYPKADYCFCDGCRERFEAETGRPVADWPKDCRSGSRRGEYRKWRQKQITQFIESVARRTKKIRPTVKISAAVFGDADGCRYSVAQDWLAWVKSGSVDFLCPMSYTDNDKYFRTLVQKQLRQVAGRVPIYPGIRAVVKRSIVPPEQVIEQIHLARQLGAPGFTLFDLRADTANKLLPVVGADLKTKKESR